MRRFEIITAYQNQNVELPKRATAHSAGYDLASAETIVILPKQIQLIPTGLKVSLLETEVLLTFARSSLAIKKGLMMSNGVGVIDADYYNNEKNEGHILVPLFNFSDEAVTIEKGERVAQGIFTTYLKTENDTTNETRREGGFGSSDKKSKK
ncbi:MAG: dUTP diphosphatase [Acholeplasmataceae bacterium]|nr:dUTP diphosphatase [Acholeplasmataceae bacterium]